MAGAEKKLTIKVPTRNMSDTLLDFGKPVLDMLEKVQPDQRFVNLLNVIIAVWNAHVLGLPVWGRPEELRKVEKVVRRDVGKIRKLDVWQALSERRRERFADDPRLIVRWDLPRPKDGQGIQLLVETQLPEGVKRAV